MTHHTLKTYSTEKGDPVCLHENKFFKMMFNGYYHYLDAVRFARGVATVPMFENGDLLLVRLRRAPAIGFSVEFPRGGVDADEEFANAAARELSEETGYQVDAAGLQRLGTVGADTATINGTMEVYRVRIPDSAFQGAYDAEEIDVPMRVTRAQFEEMVRTGKIVDGITLASWTLACLCP
jgi:ADP-ribose pyrophosphatase